MGCSDDPPEALRAAIGQAARDDNQGNLEEIQRRLAARVAEVVEREASAREKDLRRALSKVGRYNERLRDQLRRLNSAHARARRLLRHKSEEHKMLHRAARALLVAMEAAAGAQPVTVEHATQVNAAMDAVQAALPVIRPRPPQEAGS